MVKVTIELPHDSFSVGHDEGQSRTPRSEQAVASALADTIVSMQDHVSTADYILAKAVVRAIYSLREHDDMSAERQVFSSAAMALSRKWEATWKANKDMLAEIGFVEVTADGEEIPA